MPNFRLPLLLAPLFFLSHTHGQLYFDVNGSASGFGLTAGATYTWDLSNEYWNPLSNGTGEVVAWPNTGEDIARFGNVADGYTLQFTTEIEVLGMVRDNLGSTAGTDIILESDSTTPRNLVFSEGGYVEMRRGGNSGFVFGDYLNVIGDFEVRATFGSGGHIRFEGAGANHVGRITLVDENAAVWITDDTRFGTGTRIALNDGTLRLNQDGEQVIGELSGSGGFIRRAGGGTHIPILIVDQSTDTSWSGLIDGSGSNLIGFIKRGSGSLSFDNPGTHNPRREFAVEEGSLYINGILATTGAAPGASPGGQLLVAPGALFGGNGTVVNNSGNARQVILQELDGVSGILEPGAHGSAGTLTLEGGLDASSGGVFRFKMNDLDQSDQTINSFLQITGGPTSLGGTLQLEFVDLGKGNITADSPIPLVYYSGASLSHGWSIDEGSLPSGWAIGLDPLSVDNDAIYVTFAQIPEPATAAAILLALVAVFRIVRHRQGFSPKGQLL